MKHYAMLNCEIEVDERKTQQWYAQADPWGCECGHCINFLEAAKRKMLPDEVLDLLTVFGIPPEKATYVCCLNGDKENPFYQFSYRIAGNILQDHTGAPIEEARFCHETYPYGAPDFPTPHFDLEFFAQLPWIIPETEQ